MKPTNEQYNATIVFFDGYCGLCNRSVDMLLHMDRKRVLKYAPLQGSTAASFLPHDLHLDPQTIVVYDEQRIWTKTEALFRIIQKNGGMWRLLLIFNILPLSFMNWGYDLVARNRHRLFKPLATCRIPSANEADRFLS